MNLTTDPWIPVVWDSGKPDLISLRDAFEQGERIRDLAVRPHERIALMRLLICIAQVALDGPADRDDWKDCESRIVSKVMHYLHLWKDAFDLFGNGPRFLQAKGRGKPGTMELDKLDFVDADMTTLFDQDVVLGRKREASWIALRLVTYQSFAAGGTVGGSIEEKGRLRPQTGVNGPCRDSHAFHAFIRRPNLLSTVHSNLVTRETISRFNNLRWGRPVWELKSADIIELETQEIVRSYLGRLAPLSRAVWLNNDMATASNANGLQYPSFATEAIRDSTTSVHVVKDRSGQMRRVLLSAVDGDNVKKPWRELHSLAVKRISDEGVGGPLALQNLTDDSPFDLWVGALVTGKAKIEDAVESSYPIPAGMIKDETMQQTQHAYELGVRYAEAWKRRLTRAISIYRLSMESHETTLEELERKYSKLKKNIRQRYDDIGNKAYPGFWTLTEQRLDLLNRFATEPIPSRNERLSYGDTDWGKHVVKAARSSYESACSHETTRQIRAHAFGRKELFAPRPDKESKPEDEA